LTKRGQADEALGQNSQALDDFRGALVSLSELQAAKEGLSPHYGPTKRSRGEHDGASQSLGCPHVCYGSLADISARMEVGPLSDD
jgi:hypothetical protein